jgi:hypothetical protein
VGHLHRCRIGAEPVVNRCQTSSGLSWLVPRQLGNLGVPGGAYSAKVCIVLSLSGIWLILVPGP